MTARSFSAPTVPVRAPALVRAARVAMHPATLLTLTAVAVAVAVWAVLHPAVVYVPVPNDDGYGGTGAAGWSQEALKAWAAYRPHLGTPTYI